MRIRVIHTPGHTPGSVTYLLEGQGIAFTGDTVQGIGAWPGWFPYYWDVAALVGSLHRLQGLAIQKLCPSHAYCWRGCQGEPEPIRWGAELVQTLEDSLAFIASLDQACHSTRMSVQTLTVDRIMAVLERLKFPTGALQGDGSPTPAAAATIWAHLSYADRNPEL
jgi:glyoxylase-like metal-dependent hydrolase (beta-lactamase superfamily II)